jgi:hypothetical protein
MPLCKRKGDRHMGLVGGASDMYSVGVAWMVRKWVPGFCVGVGVGKCHWKSDLWGCVETCWLVVSL